MPSNAQYLSYSAFRYIVASLIMPIVLFATGERSHSLSEGLLQPLLANLSVPEPQLAQK